MTDALRDVPFNELEKEYLRRVQERKEERKKQKYERRTCRNCAFRIWGKIYTSGLTNHETWVCEKKPKPLQRKHIYSGSPLPYLQAHIACISQRNKSCELFIHKDSEEGKEIIQQRQSMSDFISDYE